MPHLHLLICLWICCLQNNIQSLSLCIHTLLWNLFMIVPDWDPIVIWHQPLADYTTNMPCPGLREIMLLHGLYFSILWGGGGGGVNYQHVCFFFFFLGWSLTTPKTVRSRHGSGIGKHNDWSPLSAFLCLWFMSSCHSAFICHSGNSFKAELHKRACNHCGRLSDVSVFPLDAFCCWIFSTATKKKKRWFLQVKYHRWRANWSCTQWKHYILSYLWIDYYCHYCYLNKFYKSPFKWSDWNFCHPIPSLQQATHRAGVKLVLGCIFGGYSVGSSWDFTEVRPMSAAGGRLAHLPELCAETLETDFKSDFKFKTDFKFNYITWHKFTK